MVHTHFLYFQMFILQKIILVFSYIPSASMDTNYELNGLPWLTKADYFLKLLQLCSYSSHLQIEFVKWPDIIKFLQCQ